MGLNGNISFSGLMNGDIGETGGTNVVANPTGTATDTLNKIQVEETIYSIDGGANVTITPSLESGTKVADYTIDSTSGSIYAPTPVEYTAGTNVQISEQNVISATDTTYTAGNNITIENGVISASGGSSINYSTNEQVVGTWINSKPIYQKTFTGTISTSIENISLSSLNIDNIINWEIIVNGEYDDNPFIIYNSTNSDSDKMNTDFYNGNLRIRVASFWFNFPYIATIRYTKTTD